MYVIYSEPGRIVTRFALRDDRTLFLFVFATDVDPFSSMLDLPTQKVILRDKFSDGAWDSLIPSFIEIRESEAGGIRMKRIGAAY